jgi:hypothetical protein
MIAKEGVDLRAMSAPIWYAANLTDQLHREITGEELVITSTNDGKHSVKRSMHYTGAYPTGHGRAIDIRVWYLDDAQAFTTQLSELLGDDYVVILELKSDGDPSHIHIHWGPVHV